MHSGGSSRELPPPAAAAGYVAAARRASAPASPTWPRWSAGELRRRRQACAIRRRRLPVAAGRHSRLVSLLSGSAAQSTKRRSRDSSPGHASCRLQASPFLGWPLVRRLAPRLQGLQRLPGGIRALPATLPRLNPCAGLLKS